MLRILQTLQDRVRKPHSGDPRLHAREEDHGQGARSAHEEGILRCRIEETGIDAAPAAKTPRRRTIGFPSACTRCTPATRAGERAATGMRPTRGPASTPTTRG